jgi:hypothetical protein
LFYDILKIIFFDFFNNHDLFLSNFLKSVVNRKEPEMEPEPQFYL